MFGWTGGQAMAMESVNPANLGFVAQWMSAHGMDPASLNPTSIQDVTSVLAPGANLQNWRNRLLAPNSGYSISASDSQGLIAASTPDTLKAALVKALSDSGMTQTPGSNLQQAQADLTNALTTLGGDLVPLTTAVTNLTAAIIGAPAFVLAPNTGPGAYLGSGSVSILPKSGRPGLTAIQMAVARNAMAHDMPIAAQTYGLDARWMNSEISAEGWKGKNSSVVNQNIDGSYHYFQQLLAQFNGHYDVAAAAYNAGPNDPGVAYFARTGDMSHLPAQTQAYVRTIEASYQANGGNLMNLNLRCEPIVVVVKDRYGHVVGKTTAILQGRATPAGQRQ
jgi:hypothetical protein